MAKLAWPSADRRKHIGARVSRLDGPVKVTGVAKYAYDVNRKEMLHAKILQSTVAVGTITNVDTSAAERMPGVVAVIVEKDRNGEYPKISYAGDMVATVAAETEEIATEALKKIKVSYDAGTPQMDDKDPSKASGREQKKDEGLDDPNLNADEKLLQVFADADRVTEGYYGLPTITHCCLEPHGQVTEYRDGELYVWPSTQNVSGLANGLTRSTGLSADQIHVDCQYMGGGFGSKFSIDRWGEVCAELSKQTGRPVKLMLERDQELTTAGHRPSAYANVKVGVKRDGTVTAMEVKAWGTGGQQRFRMPPIPYVFTKVPHLRTFGQGITTNRGLPRAWRAPNHPQACLITMSALADAAAAIDMDELAFFKKNIGLTDRAEVYSEEMDVAAKMIDYHEKAHLRGDKTPGPIKRGLGMSIHTWGGKGHPSTCTVTINPDGSVVGRLGTQDLGTGTRTVCAIVMADTLGLDVEEVRVEMGNNSLPTSRASGGSTTVGGVSSSLRDASTSALNALLDKVAPEMAVPAERLEAWGGRIQEIDRPSNYMSWKDACERIGGIAITKTGANPTSDGTELTTGGVGGCNIADVSVDIETGVVTLNEFVSVQDVGLVVDEKTAESQLYGGAIMGITYSLFEENVYDPTTGAMLNKDMEFYRLAGLGDIGTIKVHLMRGPKYEDRGVVGIGEPAVISQGAAISNAVANAIGVRVPELPLTPDRVLEALSKGGVA